MMTFKTLAAASMIALLPAVSFASITVDTEGVNGVGLFSLAGSGASTSDMTMGTSGLLLGPDQALDWNMRVINTAPPGSANTEATATYRFSVAQNATINVSSTQNPFSGLDGLTLDLLLNSANQGSTSYSFGAFAALGPVSVTPGQTIDVVSTWTGITSLFTEFDVDFLIYAQADNNPGDIPLPATALLLLGALGGLGYVARKRS